MNPSQFRNLVSGRQAGPGAGLARGLLRVAELPYTLAVGVRNWRFDRGHDVHRVEIPVVSIGNLTLGGTGKSPLVKWVARWFTDEGCRVAIVSRGYRSASGHQNDEARELAQALPQVPHIQNPDRLAAVRQAIAEHHAQVVLLDDGFQHRRLARDLDIVLIDATEPFGFGHVFPRGMLREPIDSLSRAHLVCLTRSDLIDAATRAALRQRIAQLAPAAQWCELTHAPRELRNAAGTVTPLGSLAGQSVAAFCGIGNHQGFRHTLEELGCQLVAWREFPDHHAYTTRDLTALDQWAAASQADTILCTHKDLVKIERDQIGQHPLQALVIDIHVRQGQPELEAALRRVREMTNDE